VAHDLIVPAPAAPALLIRGEPSEGARMHVVPPLIIGAGELVAWRYVEFFTAHIRNPNTRRAYARACTQFFAWCGERDLVLATIRPFDVATYIEIHQQTHSAPAVLAAARIRA